MRLLVILLLATIAVAQTPAPTASQTPASATTQDPNAKKARDLVDKMIAAMGGPAFLKYETKTEEGRTYGFYKGESKGVGNLYWRFWKWPDKDRTEYTKKRDIAIIHNGEQGYEITYKGVAFEEQETLEGYQRRRPFTVERVTREWINDPGVIFLYEGTAVADQKLAHQVSLINKKNQQVTLFIDANSNLLVKKSFTWRDPKYKDKNEEAETFGNFRMIQGVQTPLVYARILNGELTSQRFMTKVSYNSPLSESLFDVKVTYTPYGRDRKEQK
jgi:hypothetical protein